MSTALTSITTDCRSCYKCIRKCPVKSISFHDGQASIIPEECVLCGACYLTCPQGCKVIRSDLAAVETLLGNEKEVIASVAPSFLAAYPETDFASFRRALLKLGFSDAEETAVGATIVKKEYDRLCDDGKHDVIISTCCHSINLLIEKHYPSATRYLAPVLSPMLMHAKDIKRRHPEAKVVFFGPCISKKNEIEMHPGLTDAVLTFLELDKWLESKNIQIEKADKSTPVQESLARLFPIEGGILATMAKDNPSFSYLSIGGMEEAMAAIEDILSGKVHHAFIEMSSCSGSCANGPAMKASSRTLVSSYLAIKRSAGQIDFLVFSYPQKETSISFFEFSRPQKEHNEEEIAAVLAKLGKTAKKDELNCSSCGYSSCREKAIAVLEGKANLEMCLPFLMEKAKSFSNTIVENSADPIVVLDEEMKIQLANQSLADMVGVEQGKDLINKPISSIMDVSQYAKALGGENTCHKMIYLPEYDKYLVSTISYDAQFHILIGVYRDVTSEEKKKAKQKELTRESSRITSEVVEKNMRTVQEIAQLLGESTASTKIALSKLQDTLAKEECSDDE